MINCASNNCISKSSRSGNTNDNNPSKIKELCSKAEIGNFDAVKDLVENKKISINGYEFRMNYNGAIETHVIESPIFRSKTPH